MADRLEGRVFGDFRVDALVGRGAVGKVYAATQISLKRRVTLKVLDAGLFTPDEFKTRFQREAEVVARLEHPHIVPVYAFGQEESFIYYAVRHVEGRTLEETLASDLPMREGLRHLADVAEALAYAHARGGDGMMDSLIRQPGCPFSTEALQQKRPQAACGRVRETRASLFTPGRRTGPSRIQSDGRPSARRRGGAYREGPCGGAACR